MTVAIPALSWLQQSVIFFVLGAILLIGLGLAFGFIRVTGAAARMTEVSAAVLAARRQVMPGGKLERGTRWWETTTESSMRPLA